MGKRIVINLEPGTGAGARRPKRRRWVRILALFAVFMVALVVVIAVAGFFSWRRFQSTPEYSLALLVDAAQRNDSAVLTKLIDDDEIAKNMIGPVSQKAIDRYGGSMNANTQQQIDKLLPSLLPPLKQTIHDQVVGQIKSLAAGAESKPFVVLLTTVPSLVTITNQGDTAKAAVKNANVELMLRRDSDRWKLVGFNDDTVVQRVVDVVMKDLPPISTFDANSPLFKNPGRSRKRRR